LRTRIARLLMRTRHRQLAALVVTGVLVLGGCRDPYNARSKPATPQRAASQASTAGGSGDTGRPGPPPAAPYLPAATGSGVRTAALAFARAWVNWDWRTAAAQQRDLAGLSAGRLAAQLRSGARASATDASLARDKPSSRGDVVAVDLKLTRRAAAGVVVTREQSYTDGHADLGGAHYRVYLTALKRIGARWEITRWEPQP